MEQNREYWEYDNHPEGEKDEMIELLESKGLEKKDASRFIDLIATNRQFFVEFMVRGARSRNGKCTSNPKKCSRMHDAR
jgi:hypothetical protein